MSFDYSIFRLVNGASGKLQLLDWLGIFLADYFGYVIILGIIVFLFLEKDWRQRFYLFSLGALSVILSRGVATEAIRFFYYRPRPFLVLNIQPLINSDQTGSFPSGHAAAYFALAMVVYYFCGKNRENFSQKWEWWFMGAAILMGIARIFIGVHWPSDILAGALIGIGSVFLIRQILSAPTGGKAELENDSRNKFEKNSRDAINN